MRQEIFQEAGEDRQQGQANRQEAALLGQRHQLDPQSLVDPEQTHLKQTSQGQP